MWMLKSLKTNQSFKTSSSIWGQTRVPSLLVDEMPKAWKVDIWWLLFADSTLIIFFCVIELGYGIPWKKMHICSSSLKMNTFHDRYPSSHTEWMKEQQRMGSQYHSSLLLSWAVTMFPHYSLDIQRNWRVFLGDGRGLDAGWLIISSCMLTLETLMKYSVWCWNVWSFLLLQQDYFHLLRHNNGPSGGSKSSYKLPAFYKNSNLSK